MSQLSLRDLVAQLRRLAGGEIEFADLHAWLTPVLIADPLDVEQSDARPWDHAAEETRLFWRLVYLFEGADEDEGDRLRQAAERIVACLESTHDAAATYELLPLILDQERLITIITKHLAGTISRTGFLSVVAESGYAAHVKVWLEHASPAGLTALADLLAGMAYREAAARLEARPA